MKINHFIKNPFCINIISFIITYLLFTPFNYFLKEILIRFYPSYIVLFLSLFLLVFQIFALYVFKSLSLKKFVLFGIFSGYIVSILANQGSNLIVINRIYSFYPSISFMHRLVMIFVLPLLLFGWLYGLLMSMTVYFLAKKMNTLEEKNNKRFS